MINEALIFSGLFVSTLIAFFFILWSFVFIHKVRQLEKFKKHNAKILENKLVFSWMMILFTFAILTYIVSFTTGILFAVSKNNALEKTYAILFESFFLTFIVDVFVLLIILLIFQQTVILVFKNETLLTLNAIVSANSIIQIRRDLQRRWIFINWRDDKNPKRIRELKLKYSYKVKDFLKDNGLWQEQEKPQ